MDAKNVQKVLDREIKITMGCTDPGAVAYAAAKAASILEGELRFIDICLSKNIYKNALFVGIPVIKKPGIKYAALLGALVKKPELKLAVLSEVNSIMLSQLDEYMQGITVTVSCFKTDEPLYISVTCRSDTSSVMVIIRGDYDRICRVERNGEVLYQLNPQKRIEEDIIENWKFNDVYLAAIHSDFDYNSLFEHEKINKKALITSLSQEENEYLDAFIGSKHISIYNVANLARTYVLNSSKLRMSGEKVPIVSVAGSGNLGILSLLAVSAVCDALSIEIEKRGRALFLSALIAIYIKSRMNRATVICGTAIAGAAGAAAATVYLLGGGFKEAEEAVNTVLATIGGVLCDGAKESCAYKVGFAAECAVISGDMAVKEAGIKPGSGIITHDIDKNILNLGLINDRGMMEVDKIILEILSTQKK